MPDVAVARAWAARGKVHVQQVPGQGRLFVVPGGVDGGHQATLVAKNWIRDGTSERDGIVLRASEARSGAQHDGKPLPRAAPRPRAGVHQKLRPAPAPIDHTTRSTRWN